MITHIIIASLLAMYACVPAHAPGLQHEARTLHVLLVADGVPSRPIEPCLVRYARERAKEMATLERITHKGFDRNRCVNYPGMTELLTRNNVANPVQQAARSFLTSPSHRVTLMNESYTVVGVGTAYNNGISYYAVVLG